MLFKRAVTIYVSTSSILRTPFVLTAKSIPALFRQLDCILLSHYNFNLHSPTTTEANHFFDKPISHLDLLFSQLSIHSLPCFAIGLFFSCQYEDHSFSDWLCKYFPPNRCLLTVDGIFCHAKDCTFYVVKYLFFNSFWVSWVGKVNLPQFLDCTCSLLSFSFKNFIVILKF